jgi:hypothetical protein
MSATGFWFIDEEHLSSVLRDWAADCRHTNITRQAEDERFAGVIDFLYSRRANHSGMFISGNGVIET